MISCNSSTENTEEMDKTTAFENPPEWSKNAIWYQIFVERFRNGDTTNDPTPEDMLGAYPGFIPDGWKITTWTNDWYSDDEYIAKIDGQTDYYGNPIKSFSQKVQFRRYGGDLQGVLDKIDYLESLGITAIYFNPLNDAPSLHKYDARNWRHIDRNFGPAPKKDAQTMSNEIPDDPSTWQFTEADKLFLEVIKELHKRNIKVILDYSWNHTGQEFWAWKDIIKNQQSSKYKDWYWINQFDDKNTSENEFSYSGWSGVFELPEIKETQRQDHLQGVKPFEGNIYSDDTKQHILNITKRWLDPNGDGNTDDGVDGFRLDVAAELPLGFWRDYRKFVRDINPDAYLIGEVWWQQWPDKLLDPTEYLKGDIFDAVMNYRWYREARHFFNEAPDKMTVSEFVDSLNMLNKNLRSENVYSMMNLVSGHDSPRVLTSLYNKNKYKYNSNTQADSTYKIDKPDETTIKTLKLLLVHQFTYIGAPHIWAGDEMGMWGEDDPSCRKPLMWPEYTFDDEKDHPLGINRPVNKVEFNTDLFNFYKNLIEIRKNNSVLATGDIDFILIDNENEILAYSRFNDSKEVIVIFNTSDSKKTVIVPTKFAADYNDVLLKTCFTYKEKMLTFELPPRTATVFKN